MNPRRVNRNRGVVLIGLSAALGLALFGAVAIPEQYRYERVLLALLAGVLYLVLLAVVLVTVRSDLRRSAFGAAFATAPLATVAALHGRPTLLVLGLVAVAGLAALVASRSGVLVWPDVAILFVLGLAAVAVNDAATAKPKIEPLPALAAFDLPARQVEAPTSELRPPTQVDVVAVTPTPGGKATDAATHFDALLLTRVPKTGATGAVRVLLRRGKGDSAAMALARHRVDSTRFFLLPSVDCFFVPAQRGLSHRQVETLLEAYGFSSGRAKGYASSFSGLADFVRVDPGRRFNRYFSKNTSGNFLTDWTFRTSRGARRGLALPKGNDASRVQTVRVIRPTMALRGRIADASDGARQFVLVRQECFDFGPGRPVPSG
jgi:hypothetical protein